MAEFEMEDIDPFRVETDETTNEESPLLPIEGEDTDINVNTVEETSFVDDVKIDKSQEQRTLETNVDGLYELLSNKLNEYPEVKDYDQFEIKDGELYYKSSKEYLTKDGRLKPIKSIERILGKKRLLKLGFEKYELSPREKKKVEKIDKELPSTSKINNADEIELQEITNDITSSTNDLVSILEHSTQTNDLFEYPLRELLGLDKELKNIRGSLKSEISKKVELEDGITRQKRKLVYVENDTSYTNEEKDEMKKKIEDRMKRMNEDLTVRQESIDILKGKLSNQITSIKETITKVLDKDLTLREKIKVLFREQGITVVSILTAIGMALGVLIEAILPSGGSTHQKPNKGNGNDSNNAKEFIKNKLKALANPF